MQRAGLLLLLAALAVALGLTAPSAYGAATLVVDDDGMAAVGDCNAATAAFPTISAAVAAASSGDTIQVCPGNYGESVLVTQSLTFLGPNAGTSALGARGAEAHVTSLATTFNVQAADVTIDGFEINGDFGIFISGASSSGTSVLNNIVTGTTRALSLDPGGSGIDIAGNHLISNVRQLHLAGSAFSNVTMSANRFSGAAAAGIFFNGNGSIATFEFTSNEVLGGTANMAAQISNGDVSDNTFAVLTGGFLNLQINLHDSTLSSNGFDGRGTERCLQLFGSQFGLSPSNNVTVSDNDFTNCGVYGLQLSQDTDRITVTGNDFSNSQGDAINTRVGTTPAPPVWTLNSDIHINYNNITGSTGFGVNNTVMGTLDATCNWWGAANGPGPVGPGTGDKVSTNVAFSPWLVAPAPGGACTGTPPNPPPSKDACKKNGWMTYTDDAGRPFKNQGDCVGYAATGGKNKAGG